MLSFTTVATCEIPDVSGLEFPPTFEPVSGSVSYLATVEVTCTHFRPTPLVFQRMCLYDQSQDIYSLYLKVGARQIFSSVRFLADTLLSSELLS